MITSPKALRLHLAVTGRTNSGKSSFVNYITGQEVSITSPVPGTTTDVVEKAAEFLPLGPVVFLDTAGSGDTSELGGDRMKKSRRVLDRADLMFLVTETETWGTLEEELAREAQNRSIPLIIIINKTDITPPSSVFIDRLKKFSKHIIPCSTLDEKSRGQTISSVKNSLIEMAPPDYLSPPPLAEDLVKPGGHAVLIVPIDIQAPKGRLILPQVQTIRALLDTGAAGSVVKEDGYSDLLNNLNGTPDLVICDSQVVDQMIEQTPPQIPATTFSILFARYKGDLSLAARGAARIDLLEEGDKILISEACSHHPMEDDIGRVKIPRWIEEYTGKKFVWDVCSGRDYPEDIQSYQLIIHCGGCMLNRREMLSRIEKAREAQVPLTNYGLAISKAHRVIERVLSPFSDALDAYQNCLRETTGGRKSGRLFQDTY
ncbi:MAG: [FeFe] hydrogenase H-cluster maturation GTPase HydF [Spirochaetales bacterium]|nr:[FeFe] hydrogenase H-cluster maturation GTPase HydF [Spirochaetales bacterium]MCF7937536.1 [FeFe] hydrogenase H-cluster maturation GTPase HydF [Spirochaetales bacterium]